MSKDRASEQRHGERTEDWIHLLDPSHDPQSLLCFLFCHLNFMFKTKIFPPCMLLPECSLSHLSALWEGKSLSVLFSSPLSHASQFVSESCRLYLQDVCTQNVSACISPTENPMARDRYLLTWMATRSPCDLATQRLPQLQVTSQKQRQTDPFCIYIRSCNLCIKLSPGVLVT